MQKTILVIQARSDGGLAQMVTPQGVRSCGILNII